MPVSRGRTWGLLGVLPAVLLLCPVGRAEPVSFRNEVMAVLSRAGCNQGTCHGNQNGKNGFKLSLRGEDPAVDFTALTRDMLGRRADPLQPGESLLLLKPTGAVPHEGGRRFGVHSPEYDILARWIAGGLQPDPPSAPVLRQITVTPREQVLVEPAGQTRLHVQADFSNGKVRDVTRLAVYEPSNPSVTVSPNGEVRRAPGAGPGVLESSILVRYLDQRATVQLAFVPARPRFTWPDLPEDNDIDRLIFAKLRTLRTLPSPLCSDSVFLRRAYLDTLGILPTAEEARAFLADQTPDKRRRLIDRLLQRPEFADFWALKWSDLLRSEEKVLDRKGVQVFHDWIRQCIAEGKPLNEFARELLAARGSTYDHPPANYYRALRDPQTRAEVTAQVFLGIRLQCCKCHNHPFDRWTQDDYYSLAAFFARVQYKIVANKRKDKLDSHEFDGEQIVFLAPEGEVQNPRTGATLRPRFLGSPTPDLAPGADRLQALADWVASSDNPFFARTQVNRIWYHLMGRGLVDPDDDFRASNPPANGPLLEALTRDFIRHHDDLRHTVRTIMNSRTYQLAAVPNETNRDDGVNFSHALVRPLQAEQLLDALAQVTDARVRFNGYPPDLRAGQLPGVLPFRQRDQPPSEGDRFLKTFGKPDRLLACDCERSDDPTLVQAFQLITGRMLNQMLSAPDNRIGHLLAQGKSNDAILEEFYLAALSRLPTPREKEAAQAMLAQSKDRRAALEDLVWGLVNAKEFLLRQ
ncbi:MAG: DUF1549 domain-containing protein [Planctomycetes bacterium]|nr:DUF1549 domain-containing protein [Planctomycetota bacterium]